MMAVPRLEELGSLMVLVPASVVPGTGAGTAAAGAAGAGAWGREGGALVVVEELRFRRRTEPEATGILEAVVVAVCLVVVLGWRWAGAESRRVSSISANRIISLLFAEKC